ncbi:hypothetical protein D3C83_203330 [compost metagenome]
MPVPSHSTTATGMPTTVAKAMAPITSQSSANQKVRICQEKCESSQVARTSERFT